MKKRTLGSIVNDLALKTPDSRDPIEVQRTLQKEYMANLLDAVNRGLKKYSTSFFIHVETKKERLLTHTYRNYFIDRLTCPTPNYDQSVFRYNRPKGRIEYIWTIPDRETCHLMKANINNIPPEEHELLSFIIKFDNGTLLRLCKKYNGEKIDSPQLEGVNNVVPY
jgi:hypothetical protein